MPTLTQDLTIATPTTALKFDKPVTWYGSQTLAATCNFTADLTNAVQGAETYVELLSNGGFVPTFPGTMIKVGDRSWTQLPVGQSNLIKFKHLGGKVYYEFVQVPLPPPDTTPPTLISAAANGVSQIDLTFSEIVQGSPSAADFALPLSGRSIIAVSVAGTQVNLIVSPNLVGGASYQVSYFRPSVVANRLRDAAGNQVADLNSIAVINNLPDTTPPTTTGAVAVGLSVVVSFNEALATILPAAAAFSLIGAGAPAITSVTRLTATQLSLGTTGTIPGVGITLAYSQPGAPTTRLQDLAGNQVASFTTPVS